MPMILVKKNPRGKVIRELSSEEETAVKTVCGLKRPATMAQHNLANALLREMREYDAWLQCDCIRAAFGKRTILYGCAIAVGCTPTLYGLWQTFREMR